MVIFFLAVIGDGVGSTEDGVLSEYSCRVGIGFDDRMSVFRCVPFLFLMYFFLECFTGIFFVMSLPAIDITFFIRKGEDCETFFFSCARTLCNHAALINHVKLLEGNPHISRVLASTDHFLGF